MRLFRRVLPVAWIALVTSTAPVGCSLMIDLQDYEDGTCGNGVIENGEQCDGADLDGATCTSMGLGGGDLMCDGDCRFDTADCEVQPVCGDGIRNGAEQCEGTDLGGATCASVGLGGGDLTCDGDCQFITANCEVEPTCGDGVMNGTEQCDGADLGSLTCVELGLGEGDLGCRPDCTHNVDGCQGEEPCGNGTVDSGEVCDDEDFGTDSCQNRGYLGGNLTCINNCMVIDPSNCSGSATCGDLLINGPEVCDGANTVGTSCVGEGFAGGVLFCDPNCMGVNTSQCYAQCGNGVVEQNEHCDQINLNGANCNVLGFSSGSLACLQSCYFDSSGCSNPVQCAALFPPLQCNDVRSGDTSGGDSTNTLSRYHGVGCLTWDMSSSEIIYSFNPGANAQLVHVQTSNMATPLDLIVTKGTSSGVCFAGNQCQGWSLTGSGEENVVFMAQPNTTYFIIIDGFSTNTGVFELALNCL